MRILSFSAVLLLTVSATWAAEKPFASPLPPTSSQLAQPIFNTWSVLWPGGGQQSHPAAIRQASTTAAMVRVRLVDDDAGFAYVGSRVHAEPEMEGTDTLAPLEPPPPSEDSSISAESLTGNAVPLDGAAKQAEAGPVTETTVAGSRSTFGWMAGTGDQLGMLEWTSRDLAVLDYSGSDRATFRFNTGHEFRWLTGPDSTDLPPYLFSIFLDIGTGIKVADEWTLDVVVSPSWNTDFANKSHQLFRLPWQAVNTFKLSNEWKLVVGVTDLDREDIRILPVAGVIYRPMDGSAEYNLVFPRPKAAWRLSHADEGRHWGFVSGELGGNSFTIQRPNAVLDIATLRDYRLFIGYENRREKRHTSRLEFGWIFGRAVEYASGIGDYNPGQTAMIRLASDY